jgi:hypothetical protein
LNSYQDFSADKLSIHLKIIKEEAETMVENKNPKIGKILVSKGYITEKDLDAALTQQRAKFGEVLAGADLITTDQLHIALERQKEESIKIGEMCKKMGYINSEDLNWALDRIKRRLGEVLIELGALKDEELQEALTIQIESSPDT